MIKLKHLHYGWIMVIMAAFILATFSIMVYTFGVFLRPLTTEFNWDRGALSAAFSLHMLVSGGLGILTGKLSDKYGPRPLVTISGLLGGLGFLLMSQITMLWQLYLIWGLFMGVSGACSVIPVMSTIPRWFAKKRGIAIGIASTGLGLGGVIFPPLAQWLISAYGWQQAFISLGLIMLIVMIPLAQFMKHSPQRVGLSQYGEDRDTGDKQSSDLAIKGLSLTEAVKTSPLWFFGLIQFCFIFTLMVILTHIVPHTVDIGIVSLVGATMVSTIAVASLAGRNLIGIISDKVGARTALTYCLFTITLALVWLLFAREIWMLYIFAGIFGVAFGGMAPLQTLVIAELFGIGYLGIILGNIMLLGTIGGALGAPIAGTIFDISGSYNLAFIICVVISISAIILSLILLKAKAWHSC